MKKICLICGGKMKQVVGREWVCDNCGVDAWMDDYGSLCFDSEHFDDEDDDFYGIPVGCAACGGDYPNCKTSCPMFDD